MFSTRSLTDGTVCDNVEHASLQLELHPIRLEIENI